MARVALLGPVEVLVTLLEQLLAILRKAFVTTPPKYPPYASLPWGPVEPPAVRDLTRLQPRYVLPAQLLIAKINRQLAPLGWEAKVSETERTDERQRFLYGIGRLYRAPGRTGTVTDVPGASGPHPQRRAVDLYYVPKPGAAPWSEARKVLAAIAAEKLDGVVWGGNFKLKGGHTDDPHWEWPA